MSEHPNIAVLITAKSPFEAKIIASILLSENIPAYVGSGMLTDEFAASQALMNLQSVEIKVPADRLEDARKALADADAAKELLEREDFNPSPDEA